MPTIDVNGTTLNYVEAGAGDEAILFSHGFLMSHALFSAQINALSARYRCVAYDHRGQAGSAVAEDGYDMDTVAEDAAALIEALDLGPCHFVGLSMGGFVGMRLALRRPDLLRSLVLMDTSADPEPNAFKYRLLGFAANWFGLGSVAGQAMNILFGKTFMTDPARADVRASWHQHLVNGHDKTGVLRALQGVIDRDGIHDRLPQINLPTLVLTGAEDVATVPDKGRRIAAAIPGARFELIARAGHSAPVENPDAVTAAISGFFEAL